ncbi:MAG: hypothetical protein GX751_05225 [Desulfuromonadaceae bacterium]|nr:hypothetical protein [Desulfuromonadaceae bacterium]
MKNGSSRRYVLTAILVSLIGLAFCLANLFGADLFCTTEGCALYHGYRIFGLNLYAVGAAGFLATAILLIFSLRHAVGPLLMLVVAGGLLIETALVIYQYLFWVCSSCLVAALLFGLVALLALLAFPALRKGPLFILGGLWLLFTVYVSLAVAKETLFQPWALFGGQGPVQVYFSPTCPSCREVVVAILDRYPDTSRVAFIPVSKGTEDDRRLAAALPLLDRPGGAGGVLRQLFEPLREDIEPAELSLGDRFRLWSNKVCLASRGFTTIPQILSPFPLELTSPAFPGVLQRVPVPGIFDQESQSCSPLGDDKPCP